MVKRVPQVVGKRKNQQPKTCDRPKDRGSKHPAPEVSVEAWAFLAEASLFFERSSVTLYFFWFANFCFFSFKPYLSRVFFSRHIPGTPAAPQGRCYRAARSSRRWVRAESLFFFFFWGLFVRWIWGVGGFGEVDRFWAVLEDWKEESMKMVRRRRCSSLKKADLVCLDYELKEQNTIHHPTEMAPTSTPGQIVQQLTAALCVQAADGFQKARRGVWL